MNKEALHEKYTEISNKGYAIGKIAKPSYVQKKQIIHALEKDNNEDALSIIMKIAIASQQPIPQELIDCKDEDYANNVRAFLIGLHNGSIVKDSE